MNSQYADDHTFAFGVNSTSADDHTFVVDVYCQPTDGHTFASSMKSISADGPTFASSVNTLYRVHTAQALLHPALLPGNLPSQSVQVSEVSTKQWKPDQGWPVRWPGVQESSAGVQSAMTGYLLECCTKRPSAHQLRLLFQQHTG